MSTLPAHQSYLDLEPGWERVDAQRAGPFVTEETLRRPDGSTVAWDSRAHRKGRRSDRPVRSVWWRPRERGWWIAVLFAIGSTCFLVAAAYSQWGSDPGSWIGVTYFVGSLFFTSAAYLQYAEAVNVNHGPLRLTRRERFRPASWEPRRIDWLAAAIQLAGTIFFNISTFAAMQEGLDAMQANRRIWAPDVFGSICFLIASELALAEVCHRWVSFRRRSLSWWIVALNMGGSIAFGIAAIASVVVPSTDELLSVGISNVGTAVGALGFLVGALLLMPESARAAVPADAAAP